MSRETLNVFIIYMYVVGFTYNIILFIINHIRVLQNILSTFVVALAAVVALAVVVHVTVADLFPVVVAASVSAREQVAARSVPCH